MKKPADIPASVLAFLAANIGSVPELESLLVLSDEPQRSWAASEVAARVYVHPDRAAGILELLQRRGLVSAEGDPLRYRFSPADEGGRELMALVAKTYRTNIVAVTSFIHEKASLSVMEFARAFDLKKDH